MGITSLIGGLINAGKQKKAAKRSARAEQQRIKAEREKQRISQLRADVQVRKERQKTFREARLRRAQVLQAGVNAGAGFQGSTLQGALGGISSNLGASVGALNEAQGFSQDISTQNEKAADAQSEIARQKGKSDVANANNQLFQAIGGFEQSIFSAAGGGAGISSSFISAK